MVYDGILGADDFGDGIGEIHVAFRPYISLYDGRLAVFPGKNKCARV